ncbi:hypothetical protein BJX63DRAFT_392218 [Aspergillus granulosus]|uniref:Uncharacterized protein n=1 Tax=Aspergillus granulosus TaxID=176169 RepID=A0ABR4HG07_9EURO
MSSPSLLHRRAVEAAAKVRSKISRTTHDRYPWLFISPDSKADVKPVVDSWLSDKENLRDVSNTTGLSFDEDPESNIVEYYPIVWTRIAGKLKSPFPGRILVIIGLEYVDQNNGLPQLHKKTGLLPGEHVSLSGDEDLQLSDGGGGTSLFVILRRS